MNPLALQLVNAFRKHFYPPLDKNIAEWLDFNRQAGNVSPCQRGCSACCRVLVFATVAEGAVLASALLGGRPGRGAFDRVRERLEPHLVPLRDPFLSHASYSGTPCLFLRPNGDCGAYRDRPLVCRTHYVAGPKEACADPWARLTYLNFVALIEEAQAWVTKHADQLGLPSTHVPLPVAARLGVELLERGPEKFAEWLKTAERILRPAAWVSFLLKQPRTFLPVVR